MPPNNPNSLGKKAKQDKRWEKKRKHIFDVEKYLQINCQS